MNLTVHGTGYVGLVTGACIADTGNNVLCVDVDADKIARLKKGEVPIYEPGLNEIVRRNLADGRLRFTTDIAEGVNFGLLQFIAVGTPPDEDGSADMQYVLAVANSIGAEMDDYKLIVNKSTVPVGTADKVQATVAEQLASRGVDIDFNVASNPEFLKEGAAVPDFTKPDRIIIGTDSEKARELLRALYEPFNRNHERIFFLDIRSAELTKYAANAMLATKISFINEIAHICDELGIDVESVRKGIGADSRIGYSFIYPGAGYGGSCFPKDVKAIIHTAKKAGVEPLVLDAVEKRNQRQKQRMFDHIISKYGADLSGIIFAVWGLSFKPGTDDMREAPSEVLIKSLINSGARVQAFDPVANTEAKKKFPQEWISNSKLVFLDDSYAALEKSDALVLMTEWKMFRNPSLSKMKELMENLCIFDGRNQYDPDYMRENGFEYKGIGR